MCPMGLHRSPLIKKAPMQENNKDEWGKYKEAYYVLILEATFKLQISLFCKLGCALIGWGPRYSLGLFLWPMQGHTKFNQLKIKPCIVSTSVILYMKYFEIFIMNEICPMCLCWSTAMNGHFHLSIRFSAMVCWNTHDINLLLKWKVCCYSYT